jgi:hypothetical protein
VRCSSLKKEVFMLSALLKVDNSVLFSRLKRCGFTAVSDPHRQSLMKTIELLDKNQLTHFSIRRNIKQLWQQLTSEITQPTALESMKAIVHLQAILEPSYVSWQNQQIDLCNDPGWWEQRLAAVQRLETSERDNAKQNTEQLRDLWQQQSRYANYTSADLIYLYEHVFPIFTEWHRYAETELHQKGQHLPSGLRLAYQQYLNNFQENLAHEQQKIRLAFNARLFAGATKQHGQFDQGIDVIQEKLQALEILPASQSRLNRHTQAQLTPSMWLTMQQIIEREGTKNEKTDWLTLPYNLHRQQENSLFDTYYRCDQQGGTYRIPTQIHTQIPVKSPFYLKLPQFFQRFFIHIFLKYTFFQHSTCQYLLAMEQALTLWQCPIAITEGLENDCSWQGLQTLWQHLEAEQNRVKMTLSQISSFFHASSMRLLNGYMEQLHSLAGVILSKQVAMVEAVLIPFEKIALIEEDKIHLEQTVQRLQQLQSAWSQDNSKVIGELSLLSLHCHALLHRKVADQKTVELGTTAAIRLKANEPVSTEEMDAFITAQNSLAFGAIATNVDIHTQSCFTIKTKVLKPKLAELLRAELLQQPFNQDASALTIHLQKLTTYWQWAMREASGCGNNAHFHDQLLYYAYVFLKSIDKLPKQAFLEKQDTIQRVISTLLTMTESHFLGLYATLNPLAAMDPKRPMYEHDWNFFREMELAPALNTLEEELIKKGLPVNQRTTNRTLEPQPTTTPIEVTGLSFFPAASTPITTTTHSPPLSTP